MSQGVCNMPLPTAVKKGAVKAMDDGLNYYSRHDGLPELRNAIAAKMKRHNGIYANPETDVVVSAGSTGAFYCACLALLNPGDEVIIFEPYYEYHINTLIAAGAKPVYVKLSPPDWSFDLKDLAKAIGPRTKGIMINTPSNPAGKVFSLAELKDIARLAIKHDFFVFTDEIYEYFVYDGLKHISPGSLSEIKNRTITISGYSKAFSITGWRIGYCVCDSKWAKMIGYINDLVYVCGPTPLQMGVANGIMKLPDSFYQNLCRKYYLKRNEICNILSRIGLTPFAPKGAYYILADVDILPGKTSKDKSMYLLKKTGVATVPGEAFYHSKGGENIVRFCFAKSEQELAEASIRLLKL